MMLWKLMLSRLAKVWSWSWLHQRKDTGSFQSTRIRESEFSENELCQTQTWERGKGLILHSKNPIFIFKNEGSLKNNKKKNKTKTPHFPQTLLEQQKQRGNQEQVPFSPKVKVLELNFPIPHGLTCISMLFLHREHKYNGKEIRLLSMPSWTSL